MSQAIIFDTHESVKRLQAVGFTNDQAEAQTRIITELVENRLATKHDILDLQHNMKEMESRLRSEIAESKVETIKWIVGLLFAQTGLIIAAIKLIP